MLRNYVNPALNNWDKFLPCAEFAINNSYVKALDTTPFYLNYGRHPNTPINITLSAKLHDVARTAATRTSQLHVRIREQAGMFAKAVPSAPRAELFAQQLQESVQRARQLLLAARDRMRSAANARRADVAFDVGQEVLLSTRNLSFAGPNCKTLLPRWVGPFQVVQWVGPVAYRLDLLSSVRIHPVFHVSLLRPFRGDGSSRPPPTLSLEGEEEFEVERILDHRQVGRREIQYRIRWSGYDVIHDTWELESNLDNCPERLQEYWDYVGSRPTNSAPKRRTQR